MGQPPHGHDGGPWRPRPDGDWGSHRSLSDVGLDGLQRGRSPNSRIEPACQSARVTVGVGHRPQGWSQRSDAPIRGRILSTNCSLRARRVPRHPSGRSRLRHDSEPSIRSVGTALFAPRARSKSAFAADDGRSTWDLPDVQWDSVVSGGCLLQRRALRSLEFSHVTRIDAGRLARSTDRGRVRPTLYHRRMFQRREKRSRRKLLHRDWVTLSTPARWDRLLLIFACAYYWLNIAGWVA